MASTGVGLPNNAALMSTTGHDKAGPRGTWLIVAGRKRLRDLGKQQGRSGGRGAHVGRRAEPREAEALARRVSVARCDKERRLCTPGRCFCRTRAGSTVADRPSLYCPYVIKKNAVTGVFYCFYLPCGRPTVMISATDGPVVQTMMLTAACLR